MTNFLLSFLITHFIVLASYNKENDYTLATPDKTFVLPNILIEISGLTNNGETSIACVQDEKGIIFIYNLTENKIDKEINFNIAGDYEGIARVNKTIYILKSDGVIYEVIDFDSELPKVKSYTTGILAKNNEGLCYDKVKNRLLIACKGKIENGDKNKRMIYSFDLKTKILHKKPVFTFDINQIKRFAIKNNITLPTKTKKKEGTTELKLKFKTSAIAIHPITKELYLLSAADGLLLIFKQNGTIKTIKKLDSALFSKSEGITFLRNGDMLISNEGESKKVTLLLFRYKEIN